MSPLDDELRAALRTRADVLAPSPDPLAGIEERARGIRRRRTATSVLGAGLAVAAIAFAVPAVVPSMTAKDNPGFATPSPSTGPSEPAPSYVLDPASPWAPRGTVAISSVERFEADWVKRHPGSTFRVLYGQRYEPSAQDEVAFVSTGPDGARYGFATGGPLRASFLYDRPLTPGARVISFAVPGDEVRRVIAVAAPGVQDFRYGGKAMTLVTDGVATAPAEGASNDLLVRDPEGNVLFDGPVPAASQPTAAQPSNLLSWPTRGAMESDLLPRAKAALAPSLGATAEEVQLKVLFASDTDSGVEYVMGQAWKNGSDTAYPFSYAEGGTGGPVPFIGAANVKAPAALAFVVSNLPGTTTEELVVIPVPGTGQVSYDDNGSGSFRPVSGQDYLDGVVIIDRAIGESDDRLEILDGNGDLDRPTYRGPVAPFLCGMKSCS